MRRNLPSTTIFALALVLLLSGGLAAGDDDPDKKSVRGIIISTHGGGRDWGTDVIVPTMKDIRAVGANWVSIHPYARIHADGSIRFRAFNPDDPPAYLIRPIAEAHRLGLSICIKPHLAYWGSPFSWRGEITFEEEEKWQRFWRDYRSWIIQLAAACRQADGFVVGTELDLTLHFEKEWRTLITEVRDLIDAPLTYAANWTDYQKVPFWDALDVIGIQAYFPLTRKSPPSTEDIQAGWDRLLAELRDYADQQDRDILFTELGYNQSYLAAAEPWDYHVDDDGARQIQETCLRTALAAITRESRIVGALLWKWFPHPRPVGRTFPLATPRIKRIIADAWQDPR